jgi:hypothetical protein
MKKIIIVCIAAALTCSAALAQGSFKVGVRAGSTMYKIDGQAFKEGFNFGYHLGGALEIMFTKKFGIQPEVLFNQNKTETGSNLGSLTSNLNANAVTDLKYLSIPVLINIRPSGGPLMFQVGPQFGIMMDDGQTLVRNSGAAFKNGDLSLLGGVQLKIWMLRVYGRYGIGLSNISDVANSDAWRSQMIQLGAGINF